MIQNVKVYLSSDPTQRFTREILGSPLIAGIRCNTGAPITDTRVTILKNFQNDIYPIPTWIDLKCRELRIIKEAILPTDYLELNHDIEVKTPTAMYYNEGREFLVIEEIIDNNKIKVKVPENHTGRETIQFGKGASINIPDSSLKICDYLTSNDIEYIQAAKILGLHNYLLSFVESMDDINSILEIDPKAQIVAKIESKKGIEFVKNKFEQLEIPIRLLAARADLYIELDRPHEIINALKLIIQKDRGAIVGSHLLESFLELQKIPRCADFTDLGFLMDLGYKTFLFGDDLCQKPNALASALGVFEEICK